MVVDEQISLSPEPVLQEPLSYVDDAVFYINDNNPYSYKTVSGESTSLTSYQINAVSSPSYDEEGNEQPSIEISNVHIIDGETLGYTLCAIVTGDYRCGLYS